MLKKCPKCKRFKLLLTHKLYHMKLTSARIIKWEEKICKECWIKFP